MRITRESLLKITKRKIEQITYRTRHIVCIYMTGSMIYDHPFLGGTTDIDLIFIHDSEPEIEREIIPICDEVHFDIAHLSHDLFQQPRELRSNPWIGSYLCENALQMYDSAHWFEFTQASVCAQFSKPEYVIQRARPFAESAREIWRELYSGEVSPGPYKLFKYLKSLEYAANAIATLTHPPLTERRFLLNFPDRTAIINRPGLSAGLIDLFSNDSITDDEWAEYIRLWTTSLGTVGKRKDCPYRLNPAKTLYYTNAAATLWDDYPHAALWLMLRTWTLSMCYLSETTTTRKRWEKLCQSMELNEDKLEKKISDLDNYLDVVEETIDVWAQDNGIT